MAGIRWIPASRCAWSGFPCRDAHDVLGTYEIVRDSQPLTPDPFIIFTVLGVLGGTIGWR
ncbi:MAG: hypothetical protein JWN00_502 [Actinomycetia bacterium]|nr:hypothetical protein [Actinomycetes bacterium]